MDILKKYFLQVEKKKKDQILMKIKSPQIEFKISQIEKEIKQINLEISKQAGFKENLNKRFILEESLQKNKMS